MHSNLTLSNADINEALAGAAHIPVLSCSAKNDNQESIRKKIFDPILTAAHHRLRNALKNDASIPKPPSKSSSNEPPQSFWKDFLTFINDHKKLLIGDVVLIVAAIIILATLASLPIGGLPVLAGLSVLAVAGITAGVVLLLWNVGGIIGNWIFNEGSPPTDKEGDEDSVSSEDLENLTLQENLTINTGQPDPKPPGGDHHGPIYPPAEGAGMQDTVSPKPVLPADSNPPSNIQPTKS